MLRITKKRSLVLAMLGLAVAAFTATACASQPEDSGSTENASGAAVSSSAEADVSASDEIAVFTDNSTGLFPDINVNATYQNTGNRGCVACHEDIFDVAQGNGTYTHPMSEAGLKNGTYLGDCKTCHNMTTATTGNLMSENIHISHYSNAAFVDADGNCWSCHITVQTEDGIELALFEENVYDAGYGGYPSNIEGFVQDFVKQRGYDSGFMSGVTTVSDPDITLNLDQIASREDQQWIASNYERVDGEDGYAIDLDTWKLIVAGTARDGELSLDEIKSLPATEVTAAQWCAVAGINTALISNMPMKGILLSDLIDYLGGVQDGANTVISYGNDGWVASGSLQEFLDSGTLLIYENWGHDLDARQGAPLKLFTPGTSGGGDTKNLVNLEFVETEDPGSFTSNAASIDAGLTYGINTSWFDNDGVSGKIGEELALEGASFGWSTSTYSHEVEKILISLDYGQTWVETRVPEDFDADQWVHFTLDWTPEEAGTYIFKAKAVDSDGVEQTIESNLIVVVSE